MYLHHMVRGIRTNFMGIGEQLLCRVEAGHWDMYDQAYDFQYHTFKPEDSTDEATLRASEGRPP